MTGRTGTRACDGQTVDLRRSRRRRRARPARRATRGPDRRSVTPLTRRVPAPSISTRATGACSRSRTPASSQARAQRGEHAARIDAVIVGRLQREAHGRARARARARARRWAADLWRAARATRGKRAGARARGPRRRRAATHEACRSPSAGPTLPRRARRPPPARPRSRARARRSAAPSSSTRRPASPNSTSETGASIPAATPEAHRSPTAPRSSTSTERPRSRARQATARPMTPPPTTRTSSASAFAGIDSMLARGTDRCTRIDCLRARLASMPTHSDPGAVRRARLAAARLYLVCDSAPGDRELHGGAAHCDRWRRRHRAVA